MLRVDGMAMVLGKPDATAAGLFTARRAKEIAEWPNAYPFDALCLIAGGNDELSERLEGIFTPWMKAKPPARLTPEQAFDRVLESGTLDKVHGRYTAVLEGLAPVVKKLRNFRVVGHTYALLERIGAPADLAVGNIVLIAWVKDDVGPWLWPTMKRVLDDVDQAKTFAHLLLRDGFGDRVLKPLASNNEFGGLYSYADFTLEPEAKNASFWNDEIHPTETGFGILAQTLNQELRSRLPIAKQGAVN